MSTLQPLAGALLPGLVSWSLLGAFALAVPPRRARPRRTLPRRREREQRYRSVVEEQTDLVCRFAPDTTLTFVNEAYCRYFGRSRSELLGTPFLDLIPVTEHAAIREHLRRVGERPEGVTYEHRVEGAGAEVRWQQWVDQPIYDAGGRLVEFQSVGRDVTERRRAEEALRESEARVRAILRAIPDLMFLQSKDGIYLDHYAWDHQALLVPPEQFLGRSMREVLPPALAEALADCFARALASGEPQRLEYRLTLGAEERHFEARIVACEGERLLSIVRDITDRKWAEAAARERQEALQRSHAQVRRLAGRLIRAQEQERRRLARELHDDLSQKIAALGMAVGALKQQLPAPSAGAAEAIARLERWLEEISEDARSLSHQLHPAVLEHAGLGAALEAHCEEFRHQAGVQVAVSFDAGLEPLPDDVALCLYRVAQEGLHNVAKHSGASTAELAVTRVGGEVVLRLRDSGRGFDLEAARRRGGLGLVSLEERAHALDGALRIETAPGAGTCLEARLPLQTA
jgi:PAS domain S-box-containing protein